MNLELPVQGARGCGEMTWDWMKGGKWIQMIQPMSLDLIVKEFSEEYRVWTVQAESGKYLAIPDHRFPGRKPLLFFKTEYDALRLLDALLKARPALESQRLVAVEVRLLETIRRVAADKNRGQTDSFVIHSATEVSDFISQLKPKTIS
jgi:hypothetical protein